MNEDVHCWYVIVSGGSKTRYGIYGPFWKAEDKDACMRQQEETEKPDLLAAITVPTFDHRRLTEPVVPRGMRMPA